MFAHVDFPLEIQTFILILIMVYNPDHLFIVTTPTQPQLNSKVGCDMKMTLHHHHHHQHPPGTQRQQYLSCYRPNFYHTFKVGFWDQQQQ